MSCDTLYPYSLHTHCSCCDIPFPCLVTRSRPRCDMPCPCCDMPRPRCDMPRVCVWRQVLDASLADPVLGPMLVREQIERFRGTGGVRSTSPSLFLLYCCYYRSRPTHLQCCLLNFDTIISYTSWLVRLERCYRDLSLSVVSATG